MTTINDGHVIFKGLRPQNAIDRAPHPQNCPSNPSPRSEILHFCLPRMIFDKFAKQPNRLLNSIPSDLESFQEPQIP